MHQESSRSRPIQGLFTDETSPAPASLGRTVNGEGPYRDARETLRARREALLKELLAIDARVVALERQPPIDPVPNRSFGPLELVTMVLPRRAIGVVVAGVLVGVGASSLLAWGLGAPPRARDEAAIVSAAIAERPRDESPEDHRLRRQKEGEALIMSALFSSPSAGSTGSAARVARLGPSTWEVDEHVLDASGSAYTSLRMVPHFDSGGVIDGIRIFGVRPGGVPALLGLRDGDVVERVNGIGLAGADDAFAAFESARRTRRLEVDIERDGRSITQIYLVTSG